MIKVANVFRIGLMILLLVLVTNTLRAKDVILLRNSVHFECEILNLKNDLVKVKVDRKKLFIPIDSIVYMGFDNTRNPVAKALMDSTMENCLKGKADAQYNGRGFGNFLLGFLIGPIGLIGAAAGTAKPENGAHTYEKSENRDLFQDPDYRKCYAKRQRGRAATSALGGWAFILLIALAL